MNDLLAVDVALLLPDSVNERCQRMNRTLLEREPAGFPLDSTHVPHVTLVQQFVVESNVESVCQAVDKSLRQISPMTLRALEVTDSGSVVHLRLERTKKLQQLHEDLAMALAPISEPAGGRDSFHLEGEEEARDGDVRWVAEYRTQASFEKFSPHVTLGLGRATFSLEPFPFVADRIALYQLGRHCTCRHLLQRWNLKRG